MKTTIDRADVPRMAMLPGRVMIDLTERSRVPEAHRHWYVTPQSDATRRQVERQGTILAIGPDCRDDIRVGDWCWFLLAMNDLDRGHCEGEELHVSDGGMLIVLDDVQVVAVRRQ
jgi:hypothetical protein